MGQPLRVRGGRQRYLPAIRPYGTSLAKPRPPGAMGYASVPIPKFLGLKNRLGRRALDCQWLAVPPTPAGKTGEIRGQNTSR